MDKYPSTVINAKAALTTVLNNKSKVYIPFHPFSYIYLGHKGLTILSSYGLQSLGFSFVSRHNKKAYQPQNQEMRKISLTYPMGTPSLSGPVARPSRKISG
jgi:hypothetical protein